VIISYTFSLKLAYFLNCFFSLHKSQFQLELLTSGAASQRLELPAVRAVETPNFESAPESTLPFNPDLSDFFPQQNKQVGPKQVPSSSKTE